MLSKTFHHPPNTTKAGLNSFRQFTAGSIDLGTSNMNALKDTGVKY